MEENVEVYIVNGENFKYDFLIRLDMIKKFKLSQNENLEITQKQSENNEDKNEVEETSTEKKRIQKIIMVQ